MVLVVVLVFLVVLVVVWVVFLMQMCTLLYVFKKNQTLGKSALYIVGLDNLHTPYQWPLEITDLPYPDSAHLNRKISIYS